MKRKPISWIFMVLFVMGIIELNSYRRVEKRKRPGKEEYKYVKWLVIEIVVVIMIIMVKCIFEIKM